MLTRSYDLPCCSWFSDALRVELILRRLQFYPTVMSSLLYIAFIIQFIHLIVQFIG